MKTMLDDVLQFARLERMPPVALAAVALERVFADLGAALQERLAQRQATRVLPPAMPPVPGQPALVELLFQKLLANAMAYAAPGRAPHIVVQAERIGELVIVSVADDGVGIPSSELERVCAPFHRPQGYRPAGDSGLGLAICRRAASALGGRIWAESESGRGSRFNVALQAADDAWRTPRTPGRASGTAR